MCPVALLFILAIIQFLALPTHALATSGYAAQTDKECTYCHVTPGGPLTPEGETFRVNGYRLPPKDPSATSTTGTSDTAGPSSTTETTAPASGGSEDGGPMLSLPRSARLLIRWVHVLAAIAWLGGIISMFVVQTPQVAFAGIPNRYLALAWPSLLVTGATGVVLTVGSVRDLGTLADDRWGRILILKIALYLILLLLALAATFVVSPRLKQAAASKKPRPRSQDKFRAQGRTTVQYRGRVYDVTGSRLWHEGHHARRHEAWQDLTSELSGAPHGPEVLERFAMIAGGEDDPTPAVMRVFMGMTRLSIALVVALVFLVAVW